MSWALSRNWFTETIRKWCYNHRKWLRVLQEFVTTMEFLQKNVTNLMLLMITLLSTEVDLKTEFLPEFENNVSSNITVQVKRKSRHIFCSSWSISFHDEWWWKLFFIVMTIIGRLLNYIPIKYDHHTNSFHLYFVKWNVPSFAKLFLSFQEGDTAVIECKIRKGFSRLGPMNDRKMYNALVFFVEKFFVNVNRQLELGLIGTAFDLTLSDY